MIKKLMRLRFNLPLLVATVAMPLCSLAQEAHSPATLSTVTARTNGMKRMPGFLPLDWDAKTGHIFVELHLDARGRTPDLLYTSSLPFGTGSNDLGLDRGKTSRGIVVYFERVGPRVLMVEPNQSFRAGNVEPAVALPVTQSFPSSVLAGFTVAAEENDTILIDATD